MKKEVSNEEIYNSIDFLQGEKLQARVYINERYTRGSIWTVSSIIINKGIIVAYFKEGGCAALKYFQLHH